MEINLTPDVLKKWGGILLIILVLAGGLYYLNQSGVLEKLFANAPIEDGAVDPGGAAAVAGVETVFMLDYEEPASVWLERLCAVSTKSGCQVMEGFWMASIEEILETK